MQASKELAEIPYTPPKDPTEELDPWQREAFDSLSSGKNVVVDAPTTAGKTRVIEAFFSTNIDTPGFRACYTCPVKSLSNDKVKEFRELFGKDKVGIATGDIKENLDAPIVVATLETYRNSLLGIEPDLGRQIVIFDEYHYLMDISRGSAWEEAIILTPHTCQLLLLSASIANAVDFVSWLQELYKNRDCIFIKVDHRPVPLADLVYFAGAWLLPEAIPTKSLQHGKSSTPRPLSHESLIQRLTPLVSMGLTPTIIYMGKRLSCKLLAEELSRNLPPLDLEHSQKIGQKLQNVHESYRSLSFITPQLRRMIQSYGVAYHHSGLAPAARIAIEHLLKDGLLRFCTATMGLSLGINFSVRSSVIGDFQRPGEGGMTPYSDAERLQMLGRAGRRGKDVVGFSLWPNMPSYLKLANPSREDCSSKLRNDPTTFLGLISRNYNLAKIELFYKKSFLRFQHSKINHNLIREKHICKSLGVEKLPCTSAAHEIVNYWQKNKTSMCIPCPHRRKCHHISQMMAKGELAALHLHLHKINALSSEDTLTPYGEVARFFPHSGGLLIAHMIAENQINENNIMATAQLLAAVSMPRFKTPRISESYRFPYNPRKLEENLEAFYPIDLFEELYDPPFGSRNFPIIRDFNPSAGYIIYEWLRGISWQELLAMVATETFGDGDITAILYRVASYLHSIAQLPTSQLADAAEACRAQILREPLSITI